MNRPDTSAKRLDAISSPFNRHVYSVQRYVSFTAPRYTPLTRLGKTAHPICCFGEVERAVVVAVGLNPSIEEFENRRDWPQVLDHVALADRCAHYFAEDKRPGPHPWFEPWAAALMHLDSSYTNGSAAHVDLTPRATRHVREFQDDADQRLFLEMVERDLWVFFATLELCREAKLALIAGTVTGRYYINEFLQRYAPEYGWSLDGAFDRSKHPGKGKVQWHTLSTYGRRIPVFFCSSSPSDGDNRELLPQRVKESADSMRKVIEDLRT